MVEDTLTTPAAIAAFTNVASFEELYRTDFRPVLGLAFVLTGDRQTAEEVTQEAFAAAYRKWSTVSRYDAPGAWVRRVACNHAASKVRRRAREARALLRLGTQRHEPIVLDRSDEAFWNAVRRLPQRQAQAIALFYLEDLSITAISDVLRCSEGAVKTHLSRARQTLASTMTEDNDE